MDEYLRTSFEGLDREYKDGDIVDRMMPDLSHSRTQIRSGAFFRALEQDFPLFACTELRLRVGPCRVLIPDVCVFSPALPSEQVPATPPLIVLEILSPEDRLSDVRAKLEEYRQWGVAHVWLADPHGRRLYECDPGFREVTFFRLAEFGLEIKPNDIFD